MMKRQINDGAHQSMAGFLDVPAASLDQIEPPIALQTLKLVLQSQYTLNLAE
jgi:hypothetical protein